MQNCFNDILRIGNYLIVACENFLQVKNVDSEEWTKSLVLDANILALKHLDSQRILCVSGSHDLDVLCLSEDGQLVKETTKKLT